MSVFEAVGSYQVAPQPRFQEGIEAIIIKEDFILIKSHILKQGEFI